MALIYGEVDITVPDISISFINSFIKETEDQHVKLGHSKEEEVYLHRNNRPYPWNRRILQFKDRKFYNYHNRTEFQEVYNLFKELPIKEEERIVLLLQQKSQPTYDFNFHFDNDNPYGFRLCLGLDTSKTFLEQSKIKPEFQQHALDLKKIEDYMVEEQVYKIKPIKSNTVFMVNGHQYPHRVPVEQNLERAVFVIRGKLGDISNLKFLQKEEI